MAQQATGKADVRTFLSGETFGAGAVVSFMTAGTNAPFIRYHNTDLTGIIGVALNAASVTGEAIDVLLAGPTAKCLINASISAGAVVGVATDAAGRIVERGQAATTTAQVPILGIALQNGAATNALVEVLLNPEFAKVRSA